MIIAVPTNGKQLSQHFGRCRTYTFFDVDPQAREIVAERTVVPPPHQPGVLPAWIAEQGGTVVITGGMGPRAIDLFAARGVEVVLGAPSTSPREAAEAFLEGRLLTGPSSCDHDSGSHHSCG